MSVFYVEMPGPNATEDGLEDLSHIDPEELEMMANPVKMSGHMVRRLLSGEEVPFIMVSNAMGRRPNSIQLFYVFEMCSTNLCVRV